MPSATWATCSSDTAVIGTPVPCRAGSSALEVDGRVGLELGELVVADDLADGAAARAHHQGLRRAAAGPVVDAAHQVPVGDAGGDEEAVVAGDQVVGGEHEVRVEVVAGVERLLSLLVVLGPQPALDGPAQRLHRA